MKRRTENQGRVSAAIAGLLLALTSASAIAQTSFQWPDTAVDVVRYATVEQCLAASQRAQEGVDRRDARVVWRDTMPPDHQRALSPAPAIVTETARRCAARFAGSTASPESFISLFELYLVAGRDADAASLLARRLAALPDTATRVQRTAVVDTAIGIYLGAQPARVAAAEALLLERAQSRGDRIQSLAIYHQLMRSATRVGDSATARRAAERIVAAADSLTRDERESDEFEKLAGGEGGEQLVFDALNVLSGDDVFLDSLRQGTAAYAAIKRANWLRATKGRFEALDYPIGAKAPKLTADFWFPAGAASSPRPASGEISLIVFLPGHCMQYGSSEGTSSFGGCANLFAQLHRLTKRFPDLDVTIAAQTKGHFYYEKPPSPEEEAEWIRKWMEGYDVQGAIAVSTTPFWRLPSPDNRRIDQFDKAPNVKNYSFKGIWRPMSGLKVLVDQDGRIVAATGSDSLYAQFIEVLMQRGSGGV
ncbi:MAG TPA: hypothetical protein VFT57_09180 [Gemmatimonadaceae bacterium]|nr:hypothetical protein [Gemmatimonadaceae bacterium]